LLNIPIIQNNFVEYYNTFIKVEKRTINNRLHKEGHRR